MSIDSIVNFASATVAVVTGQNGGVTQRCYLSNSLGHKFVMTQDTNSGPLCSAIVSKSTDGGLTWAQDVGATRTYSDFGFNDFGNFGITMTANGDKFYVLAFGINSGGSFFGSRLSVQTYDTVAGSWGSLMTPSDGGATPLGSVWQPAIAGGIGVTSAGDVVLAWTGNGTYTAANNQPVIQILPSGSSGWVAPIAVPLLDNAFAATAINLEITDSDRIRVFSVYQNGISAVPPGTPNFPTQTTLQHCCYNGAGWGTPQSLATDFWCDDTGKLAYLGQGIAYTDALSAKRFLIGYFTISLSTPSDGHITSISVGSNGGLGYAPGDRFGIFDGTDTTDANGIVDTVGPGGVVTACHVDPALPGVGFTSGLDDGSTYALTGSGDDNLVVNVTAVPFTPASPLAGNWKSLSCDDIDTPTWATDTIESSATASAHNPANWTDPTTGTPLSFGGTGEGYPFVTEPILSATLSGTDVVMFFVQDQFTPPNTDTLCLIKRSVWNGSSWSSPTVFRSATFDVGTAGNLTWGVIAVGPSTIVRTITTTATSGVPTPYTKIYSDGFLATSGSYIRCLPPPGTQGSFLLG